MSRTFCLAIDVHSSHIDGGLGYLVSFTLPEGFETPEEVPGFHKFAADITQAVMTAGDLPLNPDRYTRKLALADLMNTIEKIAAVSDIEVGADTAPAVRIRSSNPYDSKIDIDFDAAGVHLRVREFRDTSMPAYGAMIESHGAVRILEKTDRFPFKKAPAAAPKPKSMTLPLGPGL